MLKLNPKVRLPGIVRIIYPKAIWRLKENKPVVYLTFDDGPVPEVTPWVLALLKEENIKASFFCVGENIQKHPQEFRQILDEGHLVGNHTYNHMQGLKSTNTDFFANVEKSDKLTGSILFRPPHGFLKFSQYRFLKKKYRLIMWDVLSRDFDKNLSAEKVIKNVMNFVRPGSIIIFHDSLKAENNMKVALPEVIRQLKNKGYQFKAIPFQD